MKLDHSRTWRVEKTDWHYKMHKDWMNSFARKNNSYKLGLIPENFCHYWRTVAYMALFYAFLALVVVGMVTLVGYGLYELFKYWGLGAGILWLILGLAVLTVGIWGPAFVNRLKRSRQPKTQPGLLSTLLQTKAGTALCPLIEFEDSKRDLTT